MRNKNSCRNINYFFFPIKTFLNGLLTNALKTFMGHVNKCHRALVNNPIKESFYGKRKKIINVFDIFFFISHKSNVKTFLKWILNQCPTALVNISQHLLTFLKTKRLVHGFFPSDPWGFEYHKFKTQLHWWAIKTTSDRTQL